MARAPSGNGILDIRTAAILQDVYVASEPCTTTPPLFSRDFDNIYGEATMNEMRRKRGLKVTDCKFDSARSWVRLLSSVALIIGVIGIVQSKAVFLGYFETIYGITTIESVVVCSASYGVLVLFNPISSCLVGWMGVRVTSMLGMFLFFVGLVMDGLVIHVAVLYVSHVVVMSIGGSLVYTAAISSVVDNFRMALPVALVVLAISVPAGTAIMYFFISFLLRHVTYTWTVNTLAAFILVLSTVNGIFPGKRSPYCPDPFNIDNRAKIIKECIQKSSRRVPRKCIPENGQEIPKQKDPSCVCVCLMDVNILTDLSGLLWGSIVLFTMLSAYTPYVFLIWYAWTFDPTNEPPVKLIFWFCIASAIGRAATLLKPNHSFDFNKKIFQVVVIVSGILYILIIWTNPLGWIFVWSLGAGFTDGALSTVIPRVTLQTIPRALVGSCWGCIVILSAVGVFSGPILVVCTWGITRSFVPGFVTIGICQIIAGILTQIIPNEEKETNAFIKKSLSLFSGPTLANRFNVQFGYDDECCGSKRLDLKTDCFGVLPRGPCISTLGQDYTNRCPVCQMIGKIEGCEQCKPLPPERKPCCVDSMVRNVKPVPTHVMTSYPKDWAPENLPNIHSITPPSPENRSGPISRRSSKELQKSPTNALSKDVVKYSSNHRPTPHITEYAKNRRPTPYAHATIKNRRPTPYAHATIKNRRPTPYAHATIKNRRPTPYAHATIKNRRPTPFEHPSAPEVAKASEKRLTKDVVKYPSNKRPVPMVTEFAMQRRSTPVILPSSSSVGKKTAEKTESKKQVSFRPGQSMAITSSPIAEETQKTDQRPASK